MAPGVLEDFTRETGIKVVYDTFDANETLETRLLAGKSGYDVVVPTAYFLQRQITANIFQKLDKSKLPNLANAWPVVTKRLADLRSRQSDTPPTTCGAPPASATTSRRCRKFSGPTPRSTAGTSSSSRRTSPNSRIAASTCWIPPTIFFPAALSYLGLDPNSTKQADLEKAADLVSKIRPYVRKFHSSEYLSALATGEICFVVGWSGDIMQARSRAAEAKNDIEIGYAIPKEGAQMFFDNLAIPGRREECRGGL